MGDRYTLSLKCAACGEVNEDCYYAPSSGFMDFKCGKCGKINWIETGFHAVKVENEAELKKRYEDEGFGS